MKFKKSILNIILTLTIFVLLISKVEIQKTWLALKNVQMICFLPTIPISLTVNYLLLTDKWKRILHILERKVPFKTALSARLGSYAIRGLMPIKSGEVLRVAYLNKVSGINPKTGGLSVIISLSINLIVLVNLVLIGFLLGGVKWK